MRTTGVRPIELRDVVVEHGTILYSRSSCRRRNYTQALISASRAAVAPSVQLVEESLDILGRAAHCGRGLQDQRSGCSIRIGCLAIAARIFSSPASFDRPAALNASSPARTHSFAGRPSRRRSSASSRGAQRTLEIAAFLISDLAFVEQRLGRAALRALGVVKKRRFREQGGGAHRSSIPYGARAVRRSLDGHRQHGLCARRRGWFTATPVAGQRTRFESRWVPVRRNLLGKKSPAGRFSIVTPLRVAP